LALFYQPTRRAALWVIVFAREQMVISDDDGGVLGPILKPNTKDNHFN